MSHAVNFSGIWVPLVTPFDVDNTVDHRSLAGLVESLVDAEIAGLVVCGTTGEPSALNEAEKAGVLETVLRHCNGLPVVMGVSGMTAVDVCTQVQRWQTESIAGFLVPPPYYVRPTQRGIVDFYATIASETQLPLIVYDIPYRTGVTLQLDTLRRVADISNIRAIKDCGGDARKTQALIADGRLQVLAGEDHLIFTTLCQGGAGAIAASAHLHPHLFVAMYRAICAGQWQIARRLHHSLAPLIESLFVEPNPAPLKAALAGLGKIQNQLRPPLLRASDATLQAATAAYSAEPLKCGDV
ncbi:MAG: 4-hydroxy-tetrahydrodipicolinate synthase [Steroidobacteraceae bacterium]